MPARILRSFLKKEGAPNIPIQAIGLNLYDALPTNNRVSAPEAPGAIVTRTQWLDLSSLSMANLVGKRILIVDEIDDTRTTLEYAVRELQKDVEQARQQGKPSNDAASAPPSTFCIFVLHNKDKTKRGHLTPQMLAENRYLAAQTVGDEWVCYPWEAVDIDEHDRLAREQHPS